jgi:hypothetical protein
MWLLGTPQPTIKSNPPTLGEVLRVLSFHHTFKQEKLSLSYLEVAEQLIRNVGSAGQVPILKRNIVKKVERKYKLYCWLRKAKTRRSHQHRVEDFCRSLADIFVVERSDDNNNLVLKSPTKPSCSKSPAEHEESCSNETDGSTDGEDDVNDDFAAELSKFHQQKLSAVPTKSCNLIDVILRYIRYIYIQYSLFTSHCFNKPIKCVECFYIILKAYSFLYVLHIQLQKFLVCCLSSEPQT